MKLIKLFAFSALLLGISSCNTISGVGKDIQQFGGGISAKAEGGTYKEGATQAR